MAETFIPTRVPDPEISIVAPVFRNSATLPGLVARIAGALHGRRFEIVLVVDGCADSLRAAEVLQSQHTEIGVLSLERNRGQNAAVLAGLRRALGGCAVVMDADLQDPPEALPELLSRLGRDTAAVFGGRRGAYESRGRLWTSRLYKRVVLHWGCGLPADAGLFVAMDGRMRRRLLEMQPGPHLVAMIGCAGLPVLSIPVTRARRPGGASSYNSYQRLRLALNSMLWVLKWKLANRL